MKYIKPTYKNEALETEDIVLASVQLEGGATLTQIDESTAQVGASAFDILGLR